MVDIDLSRLSNNTTVYSECEICGDSIYSSPYLRIEMPNQPWIHSKWGTKAFNHDAEPKVRIVMIMIETFVNGNRVANDLRWNPYVLEIKEVKDVEGQDREGG